jgi:GDP-L-fucose synthase
MERLITPADLIFVAGHRGMAGSAIGRALQRAGYQQILTANREELDLLDPAAVQRWFAEHQPSVVVLATAKVGGIGANSTYPADFLLDNLKIQTHVIETAWRTGVRRLLFLGSSCIYPKFAAQPIREEALLTGPLEPTNEWYAIAKITGIKLCEALRRQHGFDAISLMPTNLYGPGDNYHPTNSHVMAALIRRFLEDAQAISVKPASFPSGAISAAPMIASFPTGTTVQTTQTPSSPISLPRSWVLPARSRGTPRSSVGRLKIARRLSLLRPRLEVHYSAG